MFPGYLDDKVTNGVWSALLQKLLQRGRRAYGFSAAHRAEDSTHSSATKLCAKSPTTFPRLKQDGRRPLSALVLATAL